MKTGIYFLISAGRVIYIGQTINIDRRLQYHHIKTFDQVRFIPCDRSVLRSYESRWINRFNPIFNLKPGRKKYKSPNEISDTGLLIRVSKDLKRRVNQYVTDKRVKGGLSGMIKRFLERKTKEKI